MGKYRADSRLAPSQWETPLQSNAVSHWLGANLESALKIALCCIIHVMSFWGCGYANELLLSMTMAIPISMLHENYYIFSQPCSCRCSVFHRYSGVSDTRATTAAGLTYEWPVSFHYIQWISIFFSYFGAAFVWHGQGTMLQWSLTFGGDLLITNWGKGVCAFLNLWW